MTDTTIYRSIDAIWRSESAKIIAAPTRIMRDVGLAEDLAQDSLLIALVIHLKITCHSHPETLKLKAGGIRTTYTP